MARLIVFTVFLACAVACKGDERGRASDKGESGAMSGKARGHASATSGHDDVIRPGDDSAARRALAALMAIRAPVLDRAPQCMDYARNMSSFLAALGHQLGRLREQGKDGVPAETLARMGIWIDDRAEALDQMSRSRSLQTGELARLHRELVAAMRDLADALSKAYGASRAAPDSAEAVRVENAVANVRATLAALGALCAPSSP